MATPTSTWGGMDDILSLALEKTGVEASPLPPPPPPPLMLNGNRSVSYPGTVDDLFSSVSAPTTPHNLYTPSPGYQSTSALPGDYMPSPGWVPNNGDNPAVTTNNGGMFPQATTSNGGGASIEEELAALLESTDADYLPTLPVPDQQGIVDTNFLPFPSTSTAPPLPTTHRSQMMGDFDVLSLLGLDANGAPPPSFSQTSGYISPMRSTGSPSNARSVMTNRPVAGGMLRAQVPPATAQRAMPAAAPPTEDDIEDDDDQYAAADTYANYKPTKLNIGRMHPDPVVESSSLSSVEPPQVWFDLKLPQEVIEERKLSSLQLEAVVYACQQHMNILADGTRAGFLIGDGAGVGKGRTVAGIIYQNYLEGRKKAVWLSVSNDLKYDAQRDLSDIGAKKIKVQSLSKFQYGKISGKTNGRFRKGIVFSTYSALIGESSSGGKYRTRLNQLLHWLGPHFDGVIVFDECHKAKNLVPSGAGKPSKTGLTVLQLQKKLPKARVVYCSATGASEPRNMAYMSRLGIWGLGTQFGIFQDFIKAMERRGVGAMEIVAMDMKLRGMYIARQLSFSGVSFSIEDVGLSKDFIQVYDKAVEFWVLARKLFREAADLMDLDRKGLKSMWGQFWGSHQRFFKYLCIASKVPMTIQLAKKAISEGKCVVIGLQSTGEARTLEQLGRNAGELPGFISTSKGVLESLVKRHFPCPSDGINWSSFDNDPTLPRSCRKRKIGVRGPSYTPQTLPSDEDSSSGGEDSDSAMETSSEEEEGNDSTSEEEDDEEGSSSSSETNGDLSFFGINEPWLQKCKPSKPKKPKTAPAKKKKQTGGNFSIKPPAAALGARMKFNTKTLELEKVASPRERPTLDRMRSLPTPDIKPSPSSLPPYQPPRPMAYQRQTSEGEQRSLIDVMSSSAMATGSMSNMRNVAVKTMKEELLQKIADLGPLLPNNSLDELINGLGGPSQVAEMTGRRGRVVILDDGTIQYQLRAEVDVPVDMMNIQEKQRFMRGDKNIAVISEAASSGISLQADRRAKNQRRRVHITLELPWSADKAIQQFGRTHRSNQVSAPEYVFLISQLSGEQRFASTVAKRLESLGALTHGDRRATESRDLSRYNLDTKYGRQSLEIVLKSFVGSATPKIKSEKYDRQFFENARVAMTNVDLLSSERSPLLLTVEKESLNMSRFLNRLLGLPVELQNSVFSYFGDTLVSVIQDAKRCGKWDGGILDFGASGERVEVEESQEFVGDPAFGTATTELHRILVERGISFSDALTKLNTDCQAEEGFYLMKKARNDKHVAVMLKLSKEGSTSYIVHRPNTGVQARPEKLKVLLKAYEKCKPHEAEHWWNMQYDSSLTTCGHAFWNGRCKLASTLQQCQQGRRRPIHHVLTGSILGVWSQLEGVFNRHPSHSTRMQIFRVHSPTRRLVGILIPTACVTDLTDTLKRIAIQAAGTAAVEDTTTAASTTTTTTSSNPSSSSSPAVITIPD